MNRKTTKFVAIVIAIAMVLTSMSFLWALPEAFGAEDESQEYIDKKMDEVESYIKFIKNSYKDDLEYKKLFEAAMNGVVESLDDPYSKLYINEPDEMKLIERLSKHYVGIGITLKKSSKKNIITEVNPDGPAQEVGLRVNDLIVKIDGIDVSNKTVVEVGTLLRGDEGTTVRIVVLRDGVEIEYSITRRLIKLQAVNSKLVNNDVGYIRIASFLDINIAKQFESQYNKIIEDGAKSIIIDLRNNTGGYISGSLKIADFFIKEGDIVRYSRRGKVIGYEKATEKTLKLLPMVVLVNENTASASELLAGALQDNKVAKIVGEKTFGKGVAQKIVNMEDGNSTKLSIFYFDTPNGNKIDKNGIKPDYIVSYSKNKNAIREKEEKMKLYSNLAPMIEQNKASKGDRGLNVYAGQQRLILLGYLNMQKNNLSGIMSEETVQAIKNFQKDNGLYDYGVLDYTTMQKLEEEIYKLVFEKEKNEINDKQMKKALEILSQK